MTIRIATIEDLDLVTQLGMKFIEESNYKDYADETALRTLVTKIITSPNDQGVVLIDDDKGMIGGIVSQFLFGNFNTATELAWWVAPEHRKTKVGSELHEAFEFWAKKVGCKFITMVSIDDNVGKYYEKKGYTLQERTYTKDL